MKAFQDNFIALEIQSGNMTMIDLITGKLYRIEDIENSNHIMTSLPLELEYKITFEE